MLTINSINVLTIVLPLLDMFESDSNELSNAIRAGRLLLLKLALRAHLTNSVEMLSTLLNNLVLSLLISSSTYLRLISSYTDILTGSSVTFIGDTLTGC